MNPIRKRDDEIARRARTLGAWTTLIGLGAIALLSVILLTSALIALGIWAQA